MNRLGMMIDVSHVSDQTFADVLAVDSRAGYRLALGSAGAHQLAAQPDRRAASRAGSERRRLHGQLLRRVHRRELPPGLGRAEASSCRCKQVLAAEYAAKGQPVPYYVSNQLDRDFAARVPRPPFESLIDHFDHIIRVAGIDHVGIGTDFDGISALPEGIDSAADLPKITAALLARGHSADDLRKVLGGNLMRVFAAIQAIS